MCLLSGMTFQMTGKLTGEISVAGWGQQQSIEQSFSPIEGFLLNGDIATASTGRPGTYHCWMAEAERSAVRPQVGTEPHQ